MLLKTRCHTNNKHYKISTLFQRGTENLMIAIELGERIKELRRGMGLSQEKFALKINMDRTYFATVESGKRNISLQNIEKIAKGLNVSISELFRGIGGDENAD